LKAQVFPAGLGRMVDTSRSQDWRADR